MGETILCSLEERQNVRIWTSANIRKQREKGLDHVLELIHLDVIVIEQKIRCAQRGQRGNKKEKAVLRQIFKPAQKILAVQAQTRVE